MVCNRENWDMEINGDQDKERINEAEYILSIFKQPPPTDNRSNSCDYEE